MCHVDTDHLTTLRQNQIEESETETSDANAKNGQREGERERDGNGETQELSKIVIKSEKCEANAIHAENAIEKNFCEGRQTTSRVGCSVLSVKQPSQT